MGNSKKQTPDVPGFIDGMKFLFLALILGIQIIRGFFQFSLAQMTSQVSALTITDFKEFYESRKLQLKFLLSRIANPDNLILSLEEEANYFAIQNDWETALDLVNQALELCISPQTDDSKLDYSAANGNNLSLPVSSFSLLPSDIWQWTVEIGTDYSRQEYEMSFIESDSVILEQLNNPFIAIYLFRNVQHNRYNTQVYSYLRGDRELLQSNATLALESNNYDRYWRLEAQSDLFYQHQDLSGSFWENSLRGSWNRLLAANWRFSLYSQARYKLSFPADSSYGDVITGDVSLSLRKYLQVLTWLELMIRPSYFNENQQLGLRYSQIQGRVELNHRQSYNRFYLAQLNYYFRHFRSRQPSSEYLNQYTTIQPIAELEIPLFLPFGISARAEWESRRFSTPDISYSNYNAASLEAQVKFYFSDYNSFGLGYVHEWETHFSDNADNQKIVEQENFTANGLVISVDLVKTNGLLLNFSYQYTLRTYPNAGANDLFGFYSNRRIHSLQGLGYIPLGRHWQFQFFANYDNDRDRDRDYNDNFSTIFNIGLQYKF